MPEKSNLNIEERITEFEKTEQSPQRSRPKIQRVANYLRNRKDFAKNYSPKLVSIGPIHHGDPNLEQGEQYKLMWALKYIKNNAQNSLVLYKRIADKFEELKNRFTTDLFTDDKFSNYASEGFANLEEKLSWMLFVDGCALLQILEIPNLHIPDQMNVKVDQLVLVMHDVLLLENQLPLLVLKLLWKDNDKSTLINTMKKFLHYFHHWITPNSQSSDTEVPTHLLDLLRSIILPPKAQSNEAKKEKQNQSDDSIEIRDTVTDESNIRNQGLHATPIDINDTTGSNEAKKKEQDRIVASNQTKEKETDRRLRNWCPLPILKVLDKMRCKKAASNDITYRNIQELKAAGIRLKSSKTRRPRDVSFKHGWFAAELTLPEIVVDDGTAATFLNLIAYEMCPDFKNDYGICSFAAFMDSLIDHPDDVKALRSKGILFNSLGSDEEVATLFNNISTDLVPDMLTYSYVRDQIDKHYKNKWKTWIAQGIHTYFNNPWAFIAFVAAFVALALTFVQTWFAINPKSE